MKYKKNVQKTKNINKTKRLCKYKSEKNVKFI